MYILCEIFEKILGVAFIIVIALLLLVSCNSELRDTSISMDEWVSPDGVHYWYNSRAMAPRYDANGVLVIDGQ